jgi:hypothetical protein
MVMEMFVAFRAGFVLVPVAFLAQRLCSPETKSHRNRAESRGTPIERPNFERTGDTR